MPQLRKTGIRSPWMPAPLQGNTDPLRSTIVIGMIVPLMVVGATVWAPQPARDPNVDPLRPTIIQVTQPPIPGANVEWVARPAIVEDVAWPARPAITEWPPVPVPGASIWAPQPARDPNTDPLRPVVTVQDAPDATLAQPGTTWIGRLSRDEDTTRPARPAVVQGVPVPVPGAVLWTPTPAHETPAPPSDRVPVASVTIVGQQPLPGDVTLWEGRLTRDVTTDPNRPTIVLAGQQPVPSAVTLQLYAPRDVIPDRLMPPLVATGQQPRPDAELVWAGRITATPTDRLAFVLTYRPEIGPPAGATTWIGRLARAEADHAARAPITWAPAVPVPTAIAYWVRSGLDPTPAPPIPPGVGAYQGDAYLYDADPDTGTVSGGTIFPDPSQGSAGGTVIGGIVQAGPQQDSATGTVTGGIVQAGPEQGSSTGSVTGGSILPGPEQGSATGSISGGTPQPPEKRYD